MEYEFVGRIASRMAVWGVIFCATFASAQGIVTGSVSGVVEDPTGAVVAGAKVTARHLETNRLFTTETTSAGTFSLRTLPIGTYDLKIEIQEYRAFCCPGVGVTAAR